jgi:NhaA family Na+:H+ antiporter
MSAPTPSHRPTWLQSDARLARNVARPLERFLHVEASSGILLLGATVVALVWANSRWSAGYDALWHTEVALEIGSYRLSEDLGHWVNDGLMALFFFVVGMEIKRELVVGQLSDRRDAMLPALAALGGMVVPAVVYVAVNLGGAGVDGWGIPMATDIAFAVGVLALLGDRVPGTLKVLILSLAIVDDIGAIAVIAIFYTDEIHLGWLLAAAGGLVLIAILRKARVWYLPVYVIVGTAVWVCTLESGVHATIAGVALGLLTPARPLLHELEADRVAERLEADADITAEDVRAIGFELRESVSVAERLGQVLHPWTSYVVLPIFALANAGIRIDEQVLSDARGNPITLGVVLGLLVGKVVGVSGAAWLAVRFGLGRLPDEARWGHVVGLSALAGIGFTVSLFVTGLAFEDEASQSAAKIGVLVASALAAATGAFLLRRMGAAPDIEVDSSTGP